MKEAEATFDQMKVLNIEKTVNSYNNMQSVCARTGHIDRAEELYKEGMDIFGPQLKLINGLMMVYGRAGDLNKVEELHREITKFGMQQNQVTVTNLMVAYKNTHSPTKAFKLYEEIESDPSIEGDELFYGVFMKICARISHCEMAVKVFSKLRENRPDMSCLPINAYIKALGSREDYADQAIETFRTYIEEGMQPDMDTYIVTQSACDKVGDVKTAFDIVQYIKKDGLEMNKYIYTGLIKTYAGAVRSKYFLPSLKEVYLKDSWELFKQISVNSPDMVNVQMIDAQLLVQANALRIDQVEGLVIPLYETYGFEMTPKTYELQIRLYQDTQLRYNITRMHEKMIEKQAQFTTIALNMIQENYIITREPNKIQQVLRQFKENPKLMCYKQHQRRLWNSEHLPDPLWVALEEFDFKPGNITYSRKQFGVHHKFKDQSDNFLNKPITKTQDPKKKIPRHKLIWKDRLQHQKNRNSHSRHKDVL